MKMMRCLWIIGAVAGSFVPLRDLLAQDMLAASDPQMRAGAAIYADTCMACHGPTGTGADRLFPALAGNTTVTGPDVAPLIVIVLQGSHSPVPANPGMPALGWRLADRQAAAVLTYIRNSWGNRAAPVIASDVIVLRKQIAGTAASP